jgi:oxygen-independent coproporphyrinogen III oxidase
MAGIYLHIPFCRQNCHYCDFYYSVSLHYKSQMVEALINEIDLRKNYLENELIDSIYFGGGTPSILSLNDIENILKTIFKYFRISKSIEITLEANPDDITIVYVIGLKQMGINRISLGVQSFDNTDLTLMNRRHDSIKAEEAIRILKTIPIENFSTDLIYAVPGSSEKTLKNNLHKMVDAGTPHVSVYHLTYEDGTIFKHKIKKQRLSEIGEEESNQQYDIIKKYMVSNGYQHYEISNFAKDGFISKHNSAYWFGKKYLGLGPSAHSFNGKSRQWNIAALQKYINGINHRKPVIEKETLQKSVQYNEFVMVRLRTMWGINHKELEKKFGMHAIKRFLKETDPFIAEGSLIRSENETVMNPKKYLQSDHIISQLFIT